MPYLGRSSNFGVRSVFHYLPSAGDTSVSGADADGKTLAFADGNYIDVYLNGVKLKHDTDYNTNTANTVAGLSATAANDEVTVVVYDAFSLATGFETLGGTFGDDITFKHDGVVLNFGVDSDVTLTHVADTGLILKNTDTAGNSGVGAVLTLQTGDTDMAAGNTHGQIRFQAPDEGTGTDAILEGARIQAAAEGDFSSSSNATKLQFFASASGTVGSDPGTRMELGSDGNLTIKDMDSSDGSSATLTLQSGDTDIAADDILGTINFQAPDEANGTDAILVAAGIEAVSEGDFSSSSNATKLVFKTGASAAADSKFEIASDGSVSTPTAGTNNLRLGANAGNSIASGGNENTLIGDEAGTALTTGDQNVAIGFEALKTEDAHGRNIAIGYQALKVLDAGANGFNTVIGYQAGVTMNTGVVNTLIGYQAGDALTTGNNNVAIGHEALGAEVQGDQNVAVGVGALQAQTNSTSADVNNTAVGYNAGLSVTAGTFNTIVGAKAADALTEGDNNVVIGRAALSADTLGNNSIAIGRNALIVQNFTTDTDSNNVAVGDKAGAAVTTGVNSVLIGAQAGDALTDADFNVAMGFQALTNDTLGSGSTAIGHHALQTQNFTTATDSHNTAVGFQAGKETTTGVRNTLMGSGAGDAITTGNQNTIVGEGAGGALTDADFNVVFGRAALPADTKGNKSTAIGYNALATQNFTTSTDAFNTAVGYEAGQSVTTGIKNTFIGLVSGNAVTTGDGNVVLGGYSGNSGAAGHPDIRTSDNNIVISDGVGNVRIHYNTTDGLHFNALSAGSGNSTLKYNTSSGIVFFDTSSKKFKQNIVDSKYGLSHVMQLQSRQYEFINDGKADVGLIAEEVYDVIPELVGKDSEDKPMSVSYDRFVSVLIKAVQELSAKNDALEARIKTLEDA